MEAGTIPQDRADKQLDDFFGQVTGIKVGVPSLDGCLRACKGVHLQSVSGLATLRPSWRQLCGAGRKPEHAATLQLA